MSKFVPSLPDMPTTEKHPQMLYHCMCRDPEPDPADGQLKIKASTGYGMRIPPEVCGQLGINETDKAPLVFASEHITKTLAYAFDFHKREIAQCEPIDGTGEELAIVYNRDVAMTRKYEATVYGFSSQGFVSLAEGSRQFVSKDSVPFSKVEDTIKINTADDLMRRGLQIFSYKESFSDLHGGRTFLENRDDNFINKTMRERGLSSTNEFLSAMIKEGKIVWENQARGINPNPVLAERLGVKIPQIEPTRSAAKVATQKPPRL